MNKKKKYIIRVVLGSLIIFIVDLLILFEFMRILISKNICEWQEDFFYL